MFSDLHSMTELRRIWSASSSSDIVAVSQTGKRLLMLVMVVGELISERALKL